MKRRQTQDRGPPEGGAVIHTVEQLGPNMRKLPNGSLLCLNVPLARTGWMVYGPNETPIKVGVHGMAYVERTAEALFDPASIGSCVGAAVVDDHPDDDVTPENWKDLAYGFSLEAWQGEGDNADLILGNLLITDADLIQSVLSGKREISLGYDADYEQTADGVGRQTGIIVNHIALVEKGRCGPRCAIGDRDYESQLEKDTQMATRKVTQGQAKRRAILEGLRATVRDAEEALADGEEEDSGATHIHIHSGSGPAEKTGDEGEPTQAEDPYEKRFAAIEGGLKSVGDAVASMAEMLAGKKNETGDSGGDEDEDAKKTGDADEDDPKKDDPTKDAEEDDPEKASATKDSAALETSYSKVMAQAEILVPGFRMPTFDAKTKRRATVDAMCQARRKALDSAYSTHAGAILINGITGRNQLDLPKMGCAEVATLFKITAGAKAAMNNAAATKDAQNQNTIPVKGARTPAEINKANAEYWATHA